MNEVEISKLKPGDTVYSGGNVNKEDEVRLRYEEIASKINCEITSLELLRTQTILQMKAVIREIARIGEQEC